MSALAPDAPGRQRTRTPCLASASHVVPSRVLSIHMASADSSTVETKPKRTRNAQEILAAVAVALIAFWAPSADTGLILRILSAAAALAALLGATVGLELFEDYSATNQAKKPNPFEVKIQKVELPTAPPGGVVAAAAKMDEHLEARATPSARAARHSHHSLRAPRRTVRRASRSPVPPTSSQSSRDSRRAP